MPHRDEAASDAELMAWFYRGDEEAFEILICRWWPRLFAYFRKLGFAREEGEDLTQEALVKLYLTRERLSFDTSRPLQPFVLRIARNVGIAEWRRRKPRPSTVPLGGEADLRGEFSDATWRLLDDLFLCIWGLPEIQQTYLLLCGQHGIGEFSHEEVCGVLGQSPVQVGRISRIARASLRRCMDGTGMDGTGMDGKARN